MKSSAEIDFLSSFKDNVSSIHVKIVKNCYNILKRFINEQEKIDESCVGIKRMAKYKAWGC